MRSSDFLFRLIKALSKGDRRNFKLFARLQEGDKKYIQLFDAIDKQDAYDEKKLLKQFKGERFTKQFSVAKNYLYNYILRTLDIFQSDPHADLTSLIHKIEILIGKNLFDQAEKLLKKAKHIAARQERFGEMLELLGHERLIIQRTQKVKAFNAFIQDIQEQEKKVIDQIVNYYQVLQVNDSMYHLMKRSNAAREEEELEKAKAILATPVLSDPNLTISYRAKLKRLDTLNDCHRFLHDFEACHRCCEEIIEIFDDQNELRKEKNIKYLETLNNLGIFRYRTGNIQGAKEAFTTLREATTYNEQEKIRVAELYYGIRTAMCLELGEQREALQLIRDFEKQLPKLSGKMLKASELHTYYLFAYFFFSSGEYSEALSWVNTILNEPKTEVRTDLQCMARILQLFVHLELGNHDLLEYKVKSVYRFISNRNRLFGYEKLLLKYVKQLALVGPGENEQDILLDFLNDLESILLDPFESKAFNLLDARSWVHSKLKGTTMINVTLEKQTNP